MTKQIGRWIFTGRNSMTHHIILNSTHLTKKKGNKDLNREDSMEKVNGYSALSAKVRQGYRYRVD